MGWFSRSSRLSASESPAPRAPIAAPRSELFVWPSDGFTVDRSTVWTIPAVASGLQVISGTVGSLPIERRYKGTNAVVENDGTFLDQMDPTEPMVSTMGRVVEDLILFPAAYLVIQTRYSDGYPASARYVPAEAVSEPSSTSLDYRVTVDGITVVVDPADVIRFPSPTPGLLAVGARTIATALALESSAARLAGSDLPSGILKNTGPDMPPDQVDSLLAQWEAARRTKTTAYMNSALSFDRVQWDAAEMQLVDGREHQVAELARLMNIPSKYVNGPASSSLTYSTLETQRRELLDVTLRPYVAIIEGRLSMRDVTPVTQYARLYVDDYLRGSSTERIANATARIAAGITSPAEERDAERIPGPPPEQAPADDQAGQEVPA